MFRKRFMLAFAASFVPSSLAFADVVTSARVDLDGNGSVESVSLSVNGASYSLKVNGRTLASGEMSDAVDGFAIFDIDARDRVKEIAVHTPGPSDDDEYTFYWFDGGRLAKMGTVRRWPTTSGNGVLLVDDWRGFWRMRAKYVLGSAHELRLVPQPMHYVGAEGTVSASFPILADTDIGAGIVATLALGSRISILAAKFPTPEGSSQPGATWYLVKSASGLLGWVQEGIVFANVSGLPFAD